MPINVSVNSDINRKELDAMCKIRAYCDYKLQNIDKNAFMLCNFSEARAKPKIYYQSALLNNEKFKDFIKSEIINAFITCKKEIITIKKDHNFIPTKIDITFYKN